MLVHLHHQTHEAGLQWDCLKHDGKIEEPRILIDYPALSVIWTTLRGTVMEGFHPSQCQIATLVEVGASLSPGMEPGNRWVEQ